VTIRALSVILANAGILFIAYLAGSFSNAAYGLTCFYAKQPFGSACTSQEGLSAFLWLFVPTAAILYALWGLGFAARKLMKAK
jgi:hypothetical protein